MKMLRLVALVPALAGLVSPHQVLANHCRPVPVVTADAGIPVVGMEDIAIDAEHGVAYLSAYDRGRSRAAAKAADPAATGILRLSLDAIDRDPDGRTPLRVENLSREWEGAATFRPHGISLFRDDEGGRTLFVVNHRDEAGGGAKAIEVFDIDGERLVHRGAAGTIEDAGLCSPNDIAALDHERFLVTLDRGGCSRWQRLAEDVLSLPRAGVAYYDGNTLKPVADGILFANGIVTGSSDSDASAGKVFVAATREKAIRVYDAAALLSATAPLREPLMRLPLDSGPDNLSWGPDGRLIAAVHPDLFRLALFLKGLFGVSAAPSRLVALEPAGLDSEPEILFEDDGLRLSAATVGVVEDGRLLIGSVAGDRLGVCDYPSPVAAR